ncbi:MAG: hypothetical protein IJ220_07035 [Clostridia bacterium]|nr:hypothetical protein [Clostridia bacterium]
MGENQMIKACNFYVSQWHLFAALLPYVRDELKKNNKIIFISQDNLEKGLKQLVAKLNLKFENKNGMNDVLWLDENFVLELKEEIKPVTIVVQGAVSFIKEINTYIAVKAKELYRHVTIINCYEIYDTNDILYNILDEHDYVFNTAGMNEKSAIFHGYIEKSSGALSTPQC